MLALIFSFINYGIINNRVLKILINNRVQIFESIFYYNSKEL